ncbi:lipid A oxidase [Xaviernesmea oryzae]|uniref:Lipid A oxidase n=1 Tax=Xaviernesmea oryzae TaxID=464029 RepID=A0A1Q9ARK0_9HYPH|nr:outer membrane beta-barrel protein [Xaviernesmea oryzae]OLP58054.1 lipid A oxidase [Xaviernesmea oryzae]SEL84215.1 lipid A oxidase [Xaviernesmea oryzae]
MFSALRLPCFLLQSLFACASFAASAQAEMVLSTYGGVQWAAPGTVETSDGTRFSADWEGRSFKSPPYYGFRGTWWLTDLGLPEAGIALDYAHAKVYANDETFARTRGWTRLEFTDGLNLLTLNGFYRFQDAARDWTPYLGLGAGINIPHVEVTRPSGRRFDYQLGGATLQAQAGIDYRFTARWSAFAEYKANYSLVNVDIDSGAALKTDVVTHGINFGISLHF